MSTVEEIEAAIERLPRDQFFRLLTWLRSRFEDEQSPITRRCISRKWRPFGQQEFRTITVPWVLWMATP